MKYLLDTDTCIFWLRGWPAVRERMASIEPDSLNISVITLAELRYGAECSRRPAVNHQAIDGFLPFVAILSVDVTVAHTFSEVKARLRRDGKLIEDFDLINAATALVNRQTLVTNNTGHFDRIEGLELDNWVAS
jgi:tRNA(fMet)-specific endonuclease VapC